MAGTFLWLSYQTCLEMTVTTPLSEGSRVRQATLSPFGAGRPTPHSPCAAGHPKGPSGGARLAHAEGSLARGQVKTHVLSLFKTVTHENLPN